MAYENVWDPCAKSPEALFGLWKPKTRATRLQKILAVKEWERFASECQRSQVIYRINVDRYQYHTRPRATTNVESFVSDGKPERDESIHAHGGSLEWRR